ncbi:FAD:protein FMN transferase [Paracoccus sp. (in: a-proteobacteria)]|uniref:FAD:protein FMN transferase n=1 Tax=Paracoccus sp. TaxID=267 RepID=UPI0035B4DFFC
MTTTRRRFLALSACALMLPAAASAPHHWRGQALGADVTLTVQGGTPGAARAFFAEATRRLRGIERQFSLFSGSDLRRLNALGRLAHPSDDMLAVLKLAARVHEATDGAFDPSVQPLWQARRLGEDEGAAMALVGWQDVRIDPAEIRLSRPGMALTLNGIAQGFATDCLAEIAARHGLTRVLIDAGEIRAIGPAPLSARVEAPDGTIIRRLALRDRALATSAAFGTRIGPAGDRAHIVGPAGQAPRWALISVSAESAAVADALSTAAVLMPRPAIDAALAAFPGARLEAAAAFHA